MGNTNVCRSACGLTSAGPLENSSVLNEYQASKPEEQEPCCQPFKGNLKSLVYVETLAPRSGEPLSALKNLDISSKSKSKTISMLQTPGHAAASRPARAGLEKLAAFTERLRLAGIDASQWGTGGTKSAEQLFWEIYHQRGAVLTGQGPTEMKRVTRMVKVRLVAEIFGIDHTLVSRMQFMHDGQPVERKQVPLRKLMWLSNVEQDIHEWRQEFYDEYCPQVESWRSGYKVLLEEKLGLSKGWQQLHLIQEENGYKFTTEDNVSSNGYPGLNTLYCIHEVTLRVRDPEHTGVQVLGLPEGQEFATAEGDFNFNAQESDEPTIGTQLNIWTWGRAQAQTKKQAAAAASPAPPAPDGLKTLEVKLVRRVPLPPSSARLIGRMQAKLKSKETKPPTAILWGVLDGLKTDWAKVKKMAKSIQEPKYSLQQFNQDLSAFPELSLYLLEEASSNSGSMTDLGMSSGRSIGDEYQRTVGAFFAIYWLMRLDHDGKDGFTSGVDEQWKVVNIKSKEDPQVTQPEKRYSFREKATWEFFRKLLFDAGILEQKSAPLWGGQPKTVVNERRLVSLLALTAIHDIMKMSVILPEVQDEHAPYHGYQAGNVIGDHDHALAYVMQNYPSMLPSFKGLDMTDKRSVQFSQCHLGFNHGWFVQAEAPPGAIFTKFKDAVAQGDLLEKSASMKVSATNSRRERKGSMQGQVSQQDIAFYFLHWFTDLAGAEPTPLAGCEKFVTKFPLPVMNSFLRSFEFVERIAVNSETTVVEEYLKMRWVESVPDLGPVPQGDSSIAKMRLLCMAQMAAVRVLRDFDLLADDDRKILDVEMARTGCPDQHFSAELAPAEAVQTLAGPAFLIYYGPAFLQNLGNDSAVQRLSVLAEVYRCARELWPVESAKVGVTVSIRIDMIKSLSILELQDVYTKDDMWIMVKHNDTEAFVECSSKKKLNKMIAAGTLFQVFDLAGLSAY